MVARAVTIRQAQTRWGSCSHDDRLMFALRLVLAPCEVIEYVVVHELAHIKHKHHAREFWREVEAAFPQYRSVRRWLREHEREIMHKLS